MATNDAVLGTELAPGSDAKRNVFAAVLEKSRPAQISGATLTQIYAFSAIFWIALFVMHTAQNLLAQERDDFASISWRAVLMLLDFLLCVPLGVLVRRTLHLAFGRRVLIIVTACLPPAAISSIMGYVVWIEVLKNPGMDGGVMVFLIIQSHYNLILFLLWSTFCAVIVYAAQLQERERSLLEAQALAHEAELKMLRYQINPHFLFNTLNAVSALIVTGQTLAADAMLGKLARFFRRALSRESTAKVTLAEEVRVQLEYLEIERIRFPERLTCSTHIDDGLESALVPHLILQPLIENAIKHGVARSVGAVEIRINAARLGAQLIVRVENNARASGAGASVGEHVGLTNVARRLASFYGESGTLSSSECDGLFSVELRLPLELTL